ncbi:MAG: hypothetical protein ACXACI_19800 [Candidatus Hodarchaeales archaeon]
MLRDEVIRTNRNRFLGGEHGFVVHGGVALIGKGTGGLHYKAVVIAAGDIGVQVDEPGIAREFEDVLIIFIGQFRHVQVGLAPPEGIKAFQLHIECEGVGRLVEANVGHKFPDNDVQGLADVFSPLLKVQLGVNLIDELIQSGAVDGRIVIGTGDLVDPSRVIELL